MTIRRYQFSVMGLAALVALPSIGCSSLQAHHLMSQGADAVKAQAYDQAVADYEKAVELEPTRLDAKLALASAYQSEIVPNGPATDNLKWAHKAEASYKEVLNTDPNNAAGAAGLGSVYLNDLSDLSQARSFYTKAQQLSPNDPDVHAAMGAIDWQEVNQQVMAARNTLGATNLDNPVVEKEAPSSDKKICTVVRDKYASENANGIAEVQKSLALRPNSADTMNSLNLLYRQQADLTCGLDETARATDLANANSWNDKAVAQRKVELAKQNIQTGVVLDSQSN